MYRKSFFAALSAVVLICSVLFNQHTALTASSSLHTLSANADHVNFELNTLPAHVANGQVTIDGLSTSMRVSGQPVLPFETAFIALPPLADVSITVQAEGITETSVDHIAPEPTVTEQVERPEELAISGLENLDSALIEDKSVYGANALFPNTWVEVSEPLQSRDLRYVVVKLYPVRWNPVSGTLMQASNLSIDATFIGGTAVSGEALQLESQRNFADAMVNGEMAVNWGHIPSQTGSRAVAANLPQGQTAIKIEVDTNGIYELSRADLQAAGLNVGSVNPNTIQMMTRGESVAYQFVGDGDNTFEANEKIRFYGWAFDDSAEEELYVLNNVFWLWDAGTRTSISTIANSTGSTPLTQYRATKVTAPRISWSATYTPHWDSFEAEPDLWFWDQIKKSSSGFTTEAFPFTVHLSAPAASGADADFSVEYLTGFADEQNLSIDFNGARRHSNEIAPKRTAVIVDGTIPHSEIIDGDNLFELVISTFSQSDMFLNSITVEYWRQFVAENDYLEYELPGAGQEEATIGGFSSSQPVLAWDVTDRINPVAINVGTGDRSGSGPYSYRIANNRSDTARYAISDASGLLSPVALSSYTANNIVPAAGADWVAITHDDFTSHANTLATHRQSYSGLSTHVVDAQDIINQVGFGLPLPEAIRDYLKSAVSDWAVAPQYVLLFGDTTQNTLDLPCNDASWCGNSWITGETVFVPTFLVFEDRDLGVIPSDHLFSMVVGDDLTPDISVGRLGASTSAEMTTMVNKVILYENNLLTPEDFNNKITFIGDNFDGGGDFCKENRDAAAMMPSSIDETLHCMESASAADEEAAHAFLLDAANNEGISILNYRGHGGIQKWGTSRLLSIPRINSLTNADRPFVTLSADCLDSHFTWVNRAGIAETMLGYAGGGSAAHWGSTGLGYTYEHSILHGRFIQATFDDGLTRIGDAINTSKQFYIAADQDISEIYAFTLHGDPAMEMMRSDLDVSMTAQANGDEVTVNVTIKNNNAYPAMADLEITLPAGAVVTGSTSSKASSQSTSNTISTFTFNDPLGYLESGTVTINFTLANNQGQSVTAVANGLTGYDTNLGNNSASSAISSAPTAASLSGNSATQQASSHAGLLVLPALMLTTLIALWLHRRSDLV